MNERRKSLLSQLLKLAKSEDEVKNIDFEFLLMLAKELGVSNEELKLLFEDYIHLFPPKLEQECILQLHRLIVILREDNYLSDENKNYIHQIGLKLGLHPEAITQVINRIIERNGYVPKEELVAIFNTFHN